MPKTQIDFTRFCNPASAAALLADVERRDVPELRAKGMPTVKNEYGHDRIHVLDVLTWGVANGYEPSLMTKRTYPRTLAAARAAARKAAERKAAAPKLPAGMTARQAAEQAARELADLKRQLGHATASTPTRGLPPAEREQMRRAMGLHDPGPAVVKRQGNRLILGAHANDPAPVAKVDRAAMARLMGAPAGDEPKGPRVVRRGNRLEFHHA
jgi:hypothetical protein